MRFAQLTHVLDVNDSSQGAGHESVDHILHTIRTHLDMDVAFASHVGSREVTICHADTVGRGPISVGDTFDADGSYCQRVLDGRIPYIIPDTANVAEVANLTPTRSLPIGSHISVPIRLSNGSTYGTLCCFSHLPNYSLNERDLKMMFAFAELAAGQIEINLNADKRSGDLCARIARVIEKDDLTMAYQPIYRLDTNQVVGVECLARFPDSETRSPDTWFADAAEVGRRVELELLAVRAALRGMPYLPDDIYLAINVSPDAILSGKVKKALRGVPSGRVVLEVTEHAIVKDYVALKRALEPLRGLARVAIDDAGAGYSGLRHILDIKPDLIKLDMALTRGIDNDPARLAFATALVSFAHAIGSEIVSEGVETSAELSVLRSLGVSFGQGYFLRRPMPIAAAAQFLIARQFHIEDKPKAVNLSANSRAGGRAERNHTADRSDGRP